MTFSINVVIPKVICSHPFSFLNYSIKADFDGMCDFLLNWHFSVCYRPSDVETIWSLLKSAINTAIDRFVPSVSFTHCHSGLPIKWFNHDLHHNFKCLQTFRRKYNLLPTPNLLRKLSHLESQLQAYVNIIHAKTCFESKIFGDFALGRNSRNFSYTQSVLQQDQLPPWMFSSLYHSSLI